MEIKQKQIIGRRQMVDLPIFGIYNMEAKIDTGAYTSAIHCSKIKLFKENGISKLSFGIPLSTIDPNEMIFKTEVFKVKKIKNSFGQTEKRYIVRTKIKIGKRIIITDFSLSDRTEMRYPILIGRKLLRNKFLVDVSLNHVIDK